MLHDSIPCPLLHSQACSISQFLTISDNADFNPPVLSAVNGAGLTIAVGCAISALCIGLVAAFGIAILHTFERFVRHKWKESTALKLTAEQIRLDTASLFSPGPYRLCWPQFQYLIAIYWSVRHNHS